MEPITTAIAINAVVLYLAKKLADNNSISSFFNDFADATVSWIKPVFLTDEGKEKEFIQKLQEKPNSTAKQNAVKAAIESELEDNDNAEQLLLEMAKTIQEKEPKLTQNTVNITQHHTGSGDNVGGNKIKNQKADKIYNIGSIDKATFE